VPRNSLIRRLFLPCAALFALAVISLPESAVAKTATEERDEFFKSGPVLNLEFTLEKKEYESLQREPRKYVKATLKEGDKVIKDVGIHLKGAAGSFRGIDDKPGLTINVDKFVKGQRYRGMEKFHFSNCVQDGSYISELFAGELFRAAGVPASRMAHAIITINGKKKGLFALKEGYDDGFLKMHFGTDDGNLYDGGFLKDLDQPLEVLSSSGDVEPQTELKALMAVTREQNPKLRFEKFSKLLDMEKFISFLVIETFIWDWDGYPMNRNNYRIYHEPKKDKIIFLPSGMDQTFGEPGNTIFPNFQGVIARSVIETPQGKAAYIARMTELNNTILKPELLLKRLDELEAKVQPALLSIDMGAGRDYKNQVNRLREGVKTRNRAFTEQLGKIKK